MAIRKLMLGSNEAMQHEPSLVEPEPPKPISFVIASNPHGISLNGYQYVVDEETDKVVTFKSEKEAIQYVRDRNPDLPEDTDAELLEEEYGIYIKPEKYDEYGLNPYEESANE